MITQTHDKTYLEFFAGIGLVGKGLEGSGWRCLYAGDIDRQKREMFESHFGCRDYYHIDDVWNTLTVVFSNHRKALPGDGIVSVH